MPNLTWDANIVNNTWDGNAPYRLWTSVLEVDLAEDDMFFVDSVWLTKYEDIEAFNFMYLSESAQAGYLVEVTGEDNFGILPQQSWGFIGLWDDGIYPCNGLPIETDPNLGVWIEEQPATGLSGVFYENE